MRERNFKWEELFFGLPKPPMLLPEMKNPMADEPVREKGKTRFQCSYSSCNRVLYSNEKSPFKCSTCGHGTMRLIKPETFCCECNDPIYDNVDATRDVVCSNCVIKMLSKVNSLEAEIKGE